MYTGTGGGKTTNALGLALRMIGHGRKVVIIQFLKWRKDIGEYLAKDKLGANYEIYQFGREAWLGSEDKTARFGEEEFKIESPTDVDRELAKKGLALASEVLQRRQKPDLLVLDELSLALHWKVLEPEPVLALLNKLPAETTVVITGRFAPKELMDRADFVNLVQDIKMPNKFSLTEGIQY